jgi:hypothetical protein
MLRATPQPPTHALQSVKIRIQSAETALFLFSPSLPFFTLQVEQHNNIPFFILFIDG